MTTDPFTIHDEATAAWALDKIQTARSILAYRQSAAATWVAEAAREVAQLEERFLPELRIWGLAQLATQATKTIVLQTGRLEYRNKPARFTVAEPAQALAWAKEHLPTAVVVQEQVAAAALIDYARRTGELPAGVSRVPAEENGSFCLK
jgi:hypothetical protein